MNPIQKEFPIGPGFETKSIKHKSSSKRYCLFGFQPSFFHEPEKQRSVYCWLPNSECCFTCQKWIGSPQGSYKMFTFFSGRPEQFRRRRITPSPPESDFHGRHSRGFTHPDELLTDNDVGTACIISSHFFSISKFKMHCLHAVSWKLQVYYANHTSGVGAIVRILISLYNCPKKSDSKG